jgi:hypothetical protein
MCSYIVGGDDHARVLAQHRAQRLELRPRVGGTGRIARAVEHEHAGLRRDGRLELRRRDLVALFRAGVRRDRHAVGQQGHVGVGDPVRRRDHHLVARVDHRHEQVVDRLLGAGRHQDLRARVGDTVVALELGDDGVLEFRDALDRGVAREPVLDRRDAGLGDVRRGVEIRLTDPQPDDVVAFGFQFGDATRQGHGRRRLDALDALGELDGHGRGSGGKKDGAF